MNPRFEYELRGLAYWLECLNPLRQTITARGLPANLRLLAYKRDGVGRGLYRRKVHEPGFTRLLLARYAGPNGSVLARNFIDVGANIGYFTCLMARLAGPQGRVLALEPEPRNFQLLEANLKINAVRNVEAVRAAAGDHQGAATLHVYKPANRGRHSLLDLPAQSAVEVPVRRLDDVTGAETYRGAHWSLVKIDVEGYESFVLDGAAETLSRTETLVIEYSPELLRKAGVEPALIFEKLARNFSKISRFSGSELVPTTAADCLRSAAQTDLVFDR